ncbi:protein mono-ADP-ribosyltransferase PARP3-like [Dysidea avara]|uniref:protein mono-ADP-ribosyltransferase PARP3-like n=1 Tax=Dysidea avara TaxID=196820 RepID=UPI0033269878
MPGRKRKQEDTTDAGAAAAASAPAKEPGKMTVAELKKELQDRGLDTSGKKAELVARLEGATSSSKSGTDSTDAGKPPSAKKQKTSSAAASGKGKGKKAAAAAADSKATEDVSDFGKAVAALKSEGGKKKKRSPKVDQYVSAAHFYEVVDDWDCMLNQTNIGHNNNKYYVIQMLKSRNGTYNVWNRWGRVGEPGQTAMKGPFGSVDAATKEFQKKFTDKTKNKWENRDNFVPAPGKYTLLEMDDDDDDEAGTVVKKDETDSRPKKVKACSLDKPTQNLVKMIFDNDMFNNAMQKLELDTKKMPLGKLSKSQIAKGFEVLEEIEELFAKKSANRAKLSELSSRFYTIIPHDFGRKVPPVIDNEETLRKKFDMLLVLGDIEIAQSMQKDQQEASQSQKLEEIPHPLDNHYQMLQTKLAHIKPSESTHKIIDNYVKATESTWRKTQLIDVWEVDRSGEDKRFSAHDSLDNRRLLWHGTNVAVVAAILKSGLRIMPHSGGRVGKGIYFASENSKSAGYVRTTNDAIGIMFLAEVALGKEHGIDRDDSRLTKPPGGYDSVVARGRTEPDPKHDTSITLDKKTVAVPQGKPISTSHSNSSFSQSEYLVYKESQCRIRYMLKLKFGY